MFPNCLLYMYSLARNQDLKFHLLQHFNVVWISEAFIFNFTAVLQFKCYILMSAAANC